MPWEPPVFPGATPAPATPFRGAGPLGMLTIALLVVDVVMAIALLGSTLSQIRLVGRARDGGRVTFEEISADDRRQGGIAAAASVAYIATGIAWLIWVHRAHANLDALGARELRFSHGWATGWLVVPFANLFMVPAVMNEILRASDPGDGGVEWRNRATAAIIPAWWGTYILGSVTPRIVAGLLHRSDSLDTVITADRVLIASELLTAVAGVFAVALVRRVVSVQRARASALGLA
jgi:hypothetical protein